MEQTVTSPHKLQNVAEQIIENLPAERTQAAVLALSGELGAGKTTFVQALARELGVEEEVRSPTFLLIKTFSLPKAPKNIQRLVHIDAYRLDDPAELETLGIGDILADSTNLVAIEWAEKVEELLPDDAIHMQFEIVDENTRKLTLQQ